MKKTTFFPFIKLNLIGLLLFCILMLSQSCKNYQSEKKCCEGYTGPVTGNNANSLRNACHFMLKDTINSWTARYQANKNAICNNSLPGINKVLGDSCSFNRCIIKAIICNDSCIGLRVVYGMDPLKRVHIILVGIRPDYTTLYIPRPNECCGQPNMAKVDDNNILNGDGSKLGGAEYAQMP